MGTGLCQNHDAKIRPFRASSVDFCCLFVTNVYRYEYIIKSLHTQKHAHNKHQCKVDALFPKSSSGDWGLVWSLRRFAARQVKLTQV